MHILMKTRCGCSKFMEVDQLIPEVHVPLMPRPANLSIFMKGAPPDMVDLERRIFKRTNRRGVDNITIYEEF
jgi:hypothetical protein